MLCAALMAEIIFLSAVCAGQTNLNPPLEEAPQIPATPQSILQPKKSTAAPTFEKSEALDETLTKIVLDNMPHEYTDEKKWGKQKKRWRGIKFRRDSDDGRLETKRRYKMVNDGTWRKYAAELIDPNQEFAVELKDMKNLPSGATEFDLHFGARLKLDARQSKWVNGVQLYSVSVDGHAKIGLQVTCEMTTTMDFSNFPPDLVFSPKVTDANIEVDEFRIDRISKAGGELAQQTTKHVRKLLDEKVDEKEEKLVEKLNKQLNKKKDDLRLSVSEAIKSKWYKQAKPFLPDAAKQAGNSK